MALAAVQIINGWQHGARCYTTEPSATDDFVAAFHLVQRVHAATFDQENHVNWTNSNNHAELEVDVSCSPVAVDSFPLLVTVVETFESLLQSFEAASATTNPTQRALFDSPVVVQKSSSSVPCSSLKGDDNAGSKKRQRAASLSLSH